MRAARGARAAADRGRRRRGPGLPATLVGSSSPRAATRAARAVTGLAIAARVAERHGGRLRTAPSVRGARLVLDLPLARPAPRPARPRCGSGGVGVAAADHATPLAAGPAAPPPPPRRRSARAGSPRHR